MAVGRCVLQDVPQTVTLFPCVSLNPAVEVPIPATKGSGDLTQHDGL